VSDAEKAALAALPDVETDLKKALALGRNVGPARLDDGYLQPTLNIRAIHAGDDAPNAANAIATEGNASVDIRLAPGETPEHVRELVENYLTAQGWFIVRDTPDAATRIAHPKVLRVNWDEGTSIATKTPLDAPAAKAVAASIEHTVGYPVIKVPIVGASSGMAEIVNQLKAPMVGVSIANYDDNQHAQNENLKLANLWDGIEVYAGLLADLNW
jgi:acetylornithine deacetylase/succinyl-diaminopimelate desuccinylase-like protein